MDRVSRLITRRPDPRSGLDRVRRLEVVDPVLGGEVVEHQEHIDVVADLVGGLGTSGAGTRRRTASPWRRHGRGPQRRGAPPASSSRAKTGLNFVRFISPAADSRLVVRSTTNPPWPAPSRVSGHLVLWSSSETMHAHWCSRLRAQWSGRAHTDLRSSSRRDGVLDHERGSDSLTLIVEGPLRGRATSHFSLLGPRLPIPHWCSVGRHGMMGA